MSYIVRPQFLSGFEVEWIKSLGDQEADNFDPDLIEYAHRDFERKAEAETFAEKVLAEGAPMGDVRLTPYSLEEYEAGTRVYFKEYDGPTEYFGG